MKVRKRGKDGICGPSKRKNLKFGGKDSQG
jgi:hypothetical protein